VRKRQGSFFQPPQNLATLALINRQLVGQAEAVGSQQRVVLDMDSTENSGVRPAGENRAL
jgi:hypothetical protein